MSNARRALPVYPVTIGGADYNYIFSNHVFQAIESRTGKDVITVFKNGVKTCDLLLMLWAGIKEIYENETYEQFTETTTPADIANCTPIILDAFHNAEPVARESKEESKKKR